MAPRMEDDPQGELTRIHADVDANVEDLTSTHAERIHCQMGCSACCIDDISVFEVEADRIRTHCSEVLARTPHPVGACAFLDRHGACRIYAHRPYVCRTQGLPLRWYEEQPNRTVELRDICELNEEGPPVERLPEEECWLIGPVEGQLAELQARVDRGRRRRVRLRDLFEAAPSVPRRPRGGQKAT
ncbi:YkgJ family cysteine cluster protein [Myxococcota bacterium]|nr:YkgJ family cysteine cluster protein [Myxococcota bacterium]